MFVTGQSVFAGGLWLPKEWIETMVMIYEHKAMTEVQPGYFSGKRDLMKELLSVFEKESARAGKIINVIHKED